MDALSQPVFDRLLSYIKGQDAELRDKLATNPTYAIGGGLSPKANQVPIVGIRTDGGTEAQYVMGLVHSTGGGVFGGK
jgi:hypothetical protein